jgi:hypothetical protein
MPAPHGLATATELAATARHAIDALFTAANYSDHRRARLARWSAAAYDGR